MAKVTGPLNSSEARGSVGALTYNTWRGIHYVKARAGPVTQFSGAQVALRALTAIATAAWKALSSTQRAAWADYANNHFDLDWTGNPKRLTGYNWYCRINVRRQLLGGSIGSVPPTFVMNYHIVGLAVDGFDPLIDCYHTVTSTPWPNDLYLEYYLVGPHSAAADPSVKMATRRGYALQTADFWEYSSGSPGIWTLFARPIHSSGVAGIFQKAVGEVLA